MSHYETLPRPALDKKVSDQILSALVNTYTITTCLNCEHCDKQKSLCKKYNAQPPMHIVLQGCDDWMADIPF